MFLIIIIIVVILFLYSNSSNKNANNNVRSIPLPVIEEDDIFYDALYRNIAIYCRFPEVKADFCKWIETDGSINHSEAVFSLANYAQFLVKNELESPEFAYNPYAKDNLRTQYDIIEECAGQLVQYRSNLYADYEEEVLMFSKAIKGYQNLFRILSGIVHCDIYGNTLSDTERTAKMHAKYGNNENLRESIKACIRIDGTLKPEYRQYMRYLN